MGSILDKIAEMYEDGDAINHVNVLDLARSKGLKTQVMFDAMDIIRDNPGMSNDQAILVAGKRWNLI